MLGKIFSVLCIVSTVSATITGNVASLTGAVIDGATSAITLTVSLCGMMCLWSGIMEILRRFGAISVMSKIIRPFLRFAFPHAYKTGIGVDEITANISANILGIGNAATPMAVAAMKKMSSESDSDTATDDMVTLTVLGTAPLNLLPVTLMALRKAAGSENPGIIILPIWICSALSAFLAVLLCRMCSCLRRRRRLSTTHRLTGYGA